MKQHRKARTAAVARVAAGTLRAIEDALGPNATPLERQQAKRQIRELIETAEWRTVELPPARSRRAA